MYILLSTRPIGVLYRCPKVETLRALANIELSHISVSIVEEENFNGFAHFPVRELQELFKSLTGGADPCSANVSYLIGQIIRLCQTIEPTKVDAFTASIQSAQIKCTDKNHYKYNPGSSYPATLEEPYQPDALVGNWTMAQGLPLPNVEIMQPAPAIPKPWAVPAATTPPKYAPPWL